MNAWGSRELEMLDPQTIRLDVNQLECVIASLFSDPRVGESAQDVVRRYAEIYNQLQTVGFTVVPAK